MATRVGAVGFTIKKPREIRFLGRAAEHRKTARAKARARAKEARSQSKEPGTVEKCSAVS